MPANLSPHELAKAIGAKVGIRADFIDVYPAGARGWDASLRAVPGVWTIDKSINVKRTARGLQSAYGLKLPTG